MKSFHIDPTAGDYYSRLGLSPDASVDEIRKAGKKAFSQYHPDNDDAVDSNKLYYRLKDAKDTLEKSRDRRDYDVFYEYSEEYTAYTTQLYEQWVRKSRPRTAESWLEDNFDSDEASEVDEYTTIDELADGDVETEDPSIDVGDDSSTTPEGSDDKEGDDADDDLEDTTPSPTPTEQDDQDEGESDEDSQEGEDDAHFDQRDSGDTDSTPDDPRDSGLTESDLEKIRNKEGLRAVIRETGDRASYDDEDQSISVRAYDVFDNKVHIDLNTGKVSMERVDKSNKHQLKKVSVELGGNGRFLRVINQLRSSGGTVKVMLMSVSPSSSSSSSSDDSNKEGRDRTGGRRRPSDERKGRGDSSEQSASPKYDASTNKGDPNTTIQDTSPNSQSESSSTSDNGTTTISFLKSIAFKSSYVMILAAVSISVIGAGLYSIYTYRYVLFEIFVILSVFSPIIILFIAAIRSD